MRWRAPLVILLVLLTAGLGVADAYLGDLARTNLSNKDFNRGHERTPADLGIASQDVRIPSGRLKLAGWWMPADPTGANAGNASTTIVLVHGVGSTMGKMIRMWAPSLHAAGYSLLAFDLRNHGASPDTGGGLLTYGVDEADDVLAAVSFVQDNAADLGVDPDRVVLYGGSMGAASVLNAAAHHLPGVVGVLADSSYASFSFQAQVDGKDKGYPVWLIDLVVQHMDALAPSPPSLSRPEQALRAITVPVLLLHCSDDERVTKPNFDRLAAAAPIGTQTWLDECPTGLSRDHHLDGWMKPGYNATVLGFLDRLDRR